MDPTRVGFLAFVLSAFHEVLLTAQARLYPWVFCVLGVLLVLEGVRVCWVVGVEDGRLPQFLSLAIRVLCLVWLIPRWEWVFTTCTGLGVELGLHATGNVLTQAQFLSPGAYLELGAKIGAALDQQWASSYGLGPSGMFTAIWASVIYFVAYLLFLLAFFIMGCTLFVVQLEIAFALPLLLVKLPFLAWGKTHWIGQDSLTYVVRLAFKLFTLAVIASVTFPILEHIVVTVPPDPRQAWVMVFMAGALALVFLKGPSMAANMMQGQFTLHAGDIASTALLVLQTAMVATRAVTTAGRVASGGVALARGAMPTARGAGRTVQANAATVTQTLQAGARYMP